MFRISRDYNKERTPKGFQMVFENGYTLSIQFGMGNYCSNELPIHKQLKDYVGREYCDNSETAIIHSDGNFIEYKGVDVQSYQTPDDVAETIAYILTLPKNGGV
jgi:hypothetical protein